MCERVSVLVVFSCESLDMVVAGLDWALLWSLVLVGEGVRLQVLEDFAAFGICASSLLSRLFAAEVVLAAV